MKRFLLALSLANLLMLDTWRRVQADSAERYFTGLGLSAAAPWILGGVLLVFALVVLTLPRLLERSRPGRWGLTALEVLTFLAVLNGFRKVAASKLPVLELNVLRQILGIPELYLLVAVSVALVVAVRIWYPDALERAYRLSLTLLLPLPFILLLNLRLQGPVATPSTQSAAPARSASRPIPVVLFVFDEFDQGWTFTYRPTGLALPELDRLRSSAFVADQAYPPASETIRSIPALLTGRFLDAVKFGAGSELLLKPLGERGWCKWSDTDDLAAEASRRGLRSMMINHFHPFPPSYLSQRPGFKWQHHFYYRQWEDQATSLSRPGPFLLQATTSPLRLLPGWGAVHSPEKDTEYLHRLYLWMLDRTIETLEEGHVDLLVVHWPIPHLPVIHPPSRSARPTIRTLGNLLLVDEVLGKVRRTLEGRGRWDETLLLVTSDHWFRKVAGADRIRRPVKEDLRVPLLVKFPGQPAPFVEKTPLNNLLVWDLAVRAMDGSLPPPDQVAHLPRAQPPQGLYNPVMH